ncbi:Protein HID1 [Fasciolopsis buskii]|uniref:Protein HID1 n=1 Tax=Fasciolopsis buskii TaxID=27845 RepID=A0A8E0RQ00_9TREM|nr:Protein HID1 [Fasciolopsis buski]
MGGDNSKLNYRNVIIQLTTKTQPVDANDNAFWEQFWADVSISIQDIFVLIPAAEIRALREESPNNLATLCYKAVERLSQIAEASFPTSKDQQTALNCIRLLTRILPYIFEDPEWRSFFWSALPSEPESAVDGECVPLAQSLISALCDLLFCPDFTVHSISKSGPEGPEDMHTIDSCEYIWQAGVGFAQTPSHSTTHDTNRTEILKLLLTCFSETMYLERDEAHHCENRWVTFFTGCANRHALPLFASLLNVVCAYDPVGLGVPYNHLVFSDLREPLVEVALQVLCIVLESSELRSDLLSPPPRHSGRSRRGSEQDELTSCTGTGLSSRPSASASGQCSPEANLFVNYMSRIHRDEDFAFILSGLTRLLNSPLAQTYLPGSTKKVQMHQELLVLFWRMCEINKKFMYYVLKSSQVLDLLVPILYHLNDSRSDPARLGLVHVGVFILLLLSGERNFGVRLNKPYKNRVALDITVFTGTHADLLIIVFHKLITNGHRRLQPLFDCLLTIIVNVSPYLKSLSMVTTNKLVHLLEAFSQPWFLYGGPTHYQLVFLLLEVFNNIIQYQFDGNSNLVYTLIRKRQVFYHLASLPTDEASIRRLLKNRRQSSGTNLDHIDSVPQSPSNKFAKDDVDVKSAVSKTNNTNSTQHKQTSPEGIANPGQSSKQSDLSKTDVVKPSGDGTASGQQTFQATLAETPAVHNMTDPQLANAMSPQHHHEAYSSDTSNGTDQALDDAPLVSNFSPGRQSRTGSDESGSDAGPSSRANGANKGERSDRDSFQPQNLPGTQHLGIGEKSLLQQEPKTLGTKQSGPNKPAHGTVQPNSELTSTALDSSNCSESTTAPPDLKPVTDTPSADWSPTSEWAVGWKTKMPFQTIMRLLQVLVPQVEKICIDKGLTDESEIVKFLQNGTLVGLLPVPHPILIRKYQSNAGTAIWFRNYLWGVVYLRNVNPPIWYDTNVRLFEIQRI